MCESCGCGNEHSYLISFPGKKNSVHEKSKLKLSKPDLKSNSLKINQNKRNTSQLETREIKLETDLLHANNLIAHQNRLYFDLNSITTLNLMSSPGSGKTSLLESSLKYLLPDRRVFVIEGDQQTQNDAIRIQNAGAKAVQINTGNGCHLDALMIKKALKQLKIKKQSFLFIENVGNLVCPALFDLGEQKRVLLISVTEGDDKPLKYPNMFQAADICLINKIDLLPYVDFDIQKVKEYASRINQNIEFIEVSVKTEVGIEEWINWLDNLIQKS